jgi:AcrR family transcriptional regulator
MPRQPSARAHEDVLAAALKLIGERGIDAVSVDAIAESSGVSKATIYKHWPNKEALCLEAISTMQSSLPDFDRADARTALVQLLRHIANAPKPRALMRVMPKIVGHASSNPAFLKAWAERIEEPRRILVAQLIARAIASGQLRCDVDVNLALHLLIGPILYQRMMHTALPADAPERIVDAFWKAHAPTDLPSMGHVRANAIRRPSRRSAGTSTK